MIECTIRMNADGTDCSILAGEMGKPLWLIPTQQLSVDGHTDCWLAAQKLTGFAVKATERLQAVYDWVDSFSSAQAKEDIKAPYELLDQYGMKLLPVDWETTWSNKVVIMDVRLIEHIKAEITRREQVKKQQSDAPG